ncbi:MAG: TonB-dependent receptor [Flavobacteriales bacterium]|nr:TonB-dependent receptor [Flavobacteriales bacterium]
MLVFLVLSIGLYSNLIAQKTYTFNSPGNSCYFEYMLYAPDEVYERHLRPIVMVVGSAGDAANEVFEKDTLRNQLAFYNSLFIYVPCPAVSPTTRLNCLEPLKSLVAGHLRRSQNCFLRIQDRSIKRADLERWDLQRAFVNIQLPENSDSEFVLEEFTDEYDLEEKMGGVYYEEETEINEDNLPETGRIWRTYFGPATQYHFKLTGVIRDKSSHESLPGARILVRSTESGAISNADGYFTLIDVPSDTTTLIVEILGHSPLEVHLSPNVNKNLFVIELSPSIVMLKGVNVVAVREDVRFTDNEHVGAIRMTPKKLEVLPNIGEKDVMRSFQLMPGISAANESSSGLYVRGGTPDQNLVLYDGFTVYHVDHLYGFFSAFNSNALKDVVVYKGGYEAKYGGRLSSVTELTAKEGNQKKFNIGGDLSLLSLNAYAEIPVGDKFSSIVTFRRSYKGFLYEKIFDKFNTSSSSDTPQAGPGGRFTSNAEATSYFYDLNGKFTYRPNSKDVMSLSFYNGTDKLDNSIEIDGSAMGPGGGLGGAGFSLNSTDLTKYGNTGSSFKWSRQWNSRVYSNSLVSYSHYFSDRDRSTERNESDTTGTTNTVKNGIFENNDLRDYSFKSDIEINMGDHLKVETGMFATYYDILYNYAQNDTSSVLEKHNMTALAGAYLQTRIKLFHGKLHFVPGIRATYYDLTAKNYFEPRFAFTWKLSNKLTLKGSTGKYYQMVNRVTREDILSGSKDFWLLSDGKSIPVSSSDHYIVGLSYETNSYLFSIESYYKELYNLTEYSLRFQNRPGLTTVNENFYTGQGTAKGVEFLLQRKIGKVNGWVSYTLGQARSNFSVYSAFDYPANQDVTHEFKLVALYKYKRFDFSATWIYATGRLYTAPSGAYALTLLDGNSSDCFTVTTKNGLRLPDYHRADISVNYKLLAGTDGDRKRREIGYLGFSIFNLYNRTNIWYKQYTIVDSDIIETNVNYVGITPNLTLSLKLR